LADQLIKRQVKAKDALHIACSVVMQCDFFITTDLYLIKKMNNFEKINVVSPVDFINCIKQD
jgi:predicted nucleic acid-binding protein